MEDVLGFAAFGGLERVAIIAGALLVGYWGYRLYIDGKAAGLAFLGIACVVLFGALLTGGSHLRTVGESIQLASSRPHNDDSSGAPAAVRLASTENAASEDPVPDTGPGADAPAEEPAAAPDSAPTEPLAVSSAPDPAVASRADAQPAEDTDVVESSVPEPTQAETVAANQERLPTAQELGGRIVSVKSDNLTLEWSRTPADQ